MHVNKCQSAVLLTTSFVSFYFGFRLESTELLLSLAHLPNVSKNAASLVTSSDVDFQAVSRNGITQTLLHFIQHIAVAHRYERAIQAKQALTEVYVLASTVVKHVKRLRQEAYANDSVRWHCSEKWMGMQYGYPFYETGYVPCKTKQNISLTILINGVRMQLDTLWQLVKKISTTYPSVKITVAVKPEVVLRADKTRLRIISVNGLNEYSIWDKLIASVDTKLMLVGRNIEDVDENANFERLLRMVDHFGFDIAGGSTRNSSGHWKLGCFATASKNYIHRITEGYDVSIESCVKCDYIRGPFIIKTNAMLLIVNDMVDDDVFFLNMFEQFKMRGFNSVVCGDVMFHVATLSDVSDVSRAAWNSFADMRDFSTIITKTGQFDFQCSRALSRCKAEKGMSIPLCCLRNLSKLLQFIASKFEEDEIGYEIEAGTLLGAVKMQSVIPWELDGDMDYLSADHDKIMALRHEFSLHGYRVWESANVSDCLIQLNDTNVELTSVNCGYISISSSQWRIELWGSLQLGAHYFARHNQNINNTMVEIDGKWMVTLPSPATFPRNLYGDDIFEHVEHWIMLGYGTGWKPYTTGAWQKCKKQSYHACLGHFFTTGNYQFNDVAM